ncbi:tyrosine-type recombinase/integrase [Actinomadura rayongensis]|uniref:Tyrosine-type recombinase/integrase n=1 Tax=Actinomadura rayongensis TaxID=1429076 RepID=A0A6I4W2U9_9ACTN|nr:tyrosine-type recombinase/integrase [Actinomadura rayongensis]MXQ64949.1 tyrosine-type recombinase/integrase [Actinomadura rayongensis]
MATPRTRRPRDLRAGTFQAAINSFTLHLNAEGKSPKTVRTYVEAAQWFAGEHLRNHTDHQDWDDVTPDDVRTWMVWLLGHYSDSYANNQYRALQAFFKWWSTDEELPNPTAKLRPPAVGEKIVPVFTDAELTKLLKDCEGKNFVQRRDHAILSLFKATGMRLAELAAITIDLEDPEQGDLDLMRREVLLHGKGNKQRVVRFGHQAARSIDRYLRVRSKHAYASHRKLWLGVNNRPPMTDNGIYQMVVRRGERTGVPVFPHKFRHNFAHTWLDRGGAEGDLMEHSGWTSPQMLRRYGRSAASARARRTYDRVMEDN